MASQPGGGIGAGDLRFLGEAERHAPVERLLLGRDLNFRRRLHAILGRVFDGRLGLLPSWPARRGNPGAGVFVSSVKLNVMFCSAGRLDERASWPDTSTLTSSPCCLVAVRGLAASAGVACCALTVSGTATIQTSASAAIRLIETFVHVVPSWRRLKRTARAKT